MKRVSVKVKRRVQQQVSGAPTVESRDVPTEAQPNGKPLDARDLSISTTITDVAADKVETNPTGTSIPLAEMRTSPHSQGPSVIRAKRSFATVSETAKSPSTSDVTGLLRLLLKSQMQMVTEQRQTRKLLEALVDKRKGAIRTVTAVDDVTFSIVSPNEKAESVVFDVLAKAATQVAALLHAHEASKVDMVVPNPDPGHLNPAKRRGLRQMNVVFRKSVAKTVKNLETAIDNSYQAIRVFRHQQRYRIQCPNFLLWYISNCLMMCEIEQVSSVTGNVGAPVQLLPMRLSMILRDVVVDRDHTGTAGGDHLLVLIVKSIRRLVSSGASRSATCLEQVFRAIYPPGCIIDCFPVAYYFENLWQLDASLYDEPHLASLYSYFNIVRPDMAAHLALVNEILGKSLLYVTPLVSRVLDGYLGWTHVPTLPPISPTIPLPTLSTAKQDGGFCQQCRESAIYTIASGYRYCQHCQTGQHVIQLSESSLAVDTNTGLTATNTPRLNDSGVLMDDDDTDIKPDTQFTIPSPRSVPHSPTLARDSDRSGRGDDGLVE